MTALTASAGPDPVTLITGVLLALAAIISSLTPVLLNRRQRRKEAAAATAAATVTSGDLTLAGWTALNAALQQEIGRLQGVTGRMQARIDLLEGEVADLQRVAIGLRRDGSA